MVADPRRGVDPGSTTTRSNAERQPRQRAAVREAVRGEHAQAAVAEVARASGSRPSPPAARSARARQRTSTITSAARRARVDRHEVELVATDVDVPGEDRPAGGASRARRAARRIAGLLRRGACPRAHATSDVSDDSQAGPLPGGQAAAYRAARDGDRNDLSPAGCTTTAGSCASATPSADRCEHPRRAVQALLVHLERAGFEEAPRFLGIDDQGREILSYIEGDVPLPPYPPGPSRTKRSSARRSGPTVPRGGASFDAGGIAAGAPNGPTPRGGPVVCHNDLFPTRTWSSGGGLPRRADRLRGGVPGPADLGTWRSPRRCGRRMTDACGPGRAAAAVGRRTAVGLLAAGVRLARGTGGRVRRRHRRRACAIPGAHAARRSRTATKSCSTTGTSTAVTSQAAADGGLVREPARRRSLRRFQSRRVGELRRRQLQRVEVAEVERRRRRP